MCLEDIRIGRSVRGDLVKVIAPSGSVVSICPPNPKRIRLIVNGSNGTEVIVGTNQADILSQGGFSTGLLNGPLVLRIEDIGRVICEQWFMTGIGVSAPCAVIDLSLEAE